KRLLYLIVIAVVVISLAGCEQIRIGDINADPGRFMNKEVGVSGRVTQSFGVLGKGVYEIDDGTGHLWIWSETHGVPSKGVYVGVKGRIIPTVTFMGQNYTTVMREVERRDVAPGR